MEYVLFFLSRKSDLFFFLQKQTLLPSPVQVLVSVADPRSEPPQNPFSLLYLILSLFPFLLHHDSHLSFGHLLSHRMSLLPVSVRQLPSFFSAGNVPFLLKILPLAKVLRHLYPWQAVPLFCSLPLLPFVLPAHSLPAVFSFPASVAVFLPFPPQYPPSLPVPHPVLAILLSGGP